MQIQKCAKNFEYKRMNYSLVVNYITGRKSEIKEIKRPNAAQMRKESSSSDSKEIQKEKRE